MKRRVPLRNHTAARPHIPQVVHLADERCSIAEIAAALELDERLVRTAMYLAPSTALADRKWRPQQCVR